MSYAELSGPDLLKACGDSGMKWAEAFQEIVVTPGLKIDEDLMLGWFANAIEYSNDMRRWAREKAEREQGAQTVDKPIPGSDLTPIEIAAQCWCDPRTSSCVMDERLATVFAERLAAEIARVSARAA